MSNSNGDDDDDCGFNSNEGGTDVFDDCGGYNDDDSVHKN